MIAIEERTCVEESVGWEWCEREPYRLWSLIDMRRFFGATFITVLLKVEYARAQLVMGREAETLSLFRESLSELSGMLDEIQASSVLREQLKRLAELAEKTQPEDDVGGIILVDRSGELHQNLVQELTAYLFFAVPPSRKWIYLNPNGVFTEGVIKRFPDCVQDVRDACQCYALAQWTASVFHSMRILERGLRSLASDLGITAIDDENWKNILDLIEKAVRRIEAEPKSLDKTARARFYSEACIQFRYFKDAWRNHVSHGKQSYDEQAAISVLTHVRDFMQHLATQLKEQE